MTHRSRIGVVLVDHPEPAFDDAVAFWAGVQGVEPAVESDEFRALGSTGTVQVAAQRLGAGTAARVHLDVETDDVDAEVVRVVTLGATVETTYDGWTVLRDPGGLLFCVVPVQTGADFDAHATSWP